MAFRDYSQQFAPVNVFGGLGKGLGEGLGAGVTKAIRRPLFKRLTDDFATKRQEQAQLANLAKLKAANPEAGALDMINQYPLFEQMMAADMAPIDARVQTAQNLFEMGDYEAAKDYLLDDPAAVAAKGGSTTKPTKGEILMNAEQAKQAMLDANQAGLNAEFALTSEGGQTPENWDALKIAHDALDRAAAEFTIASAGSGVKASDVLPSLSQRMTRMKSLLDAKNTASNIRGKNSGIVNDVLDRIQKTIREIANKPKVQNWTNSAQLLSTSADQIQMYIDNFDKWKTQPNVLFGAVKELGKAIEPGLQVTEGEVAGFLGQNRVSAFIGGLQELGESFKAAFGFDATDKQAGSKLLRKMQEAAATDQPEVLKDILIQASNVIANAQNSYGKFIFEAKENAENIGGPEIKTRTRYLDDTDKQNIKDTVNQYIDSQFSNLAMFSEMQRQTPGGALVSSQTAPAGGDGGWDTDFTPYADGEPYKGPQFYADGTEASLTDDPRKLKANEERMKQKQATLPPETGTQSSSLNPVNNAAQKAADAAVTSIFANLSPEEKQAKLDKWKKRKAKK